MDFLEGGNVHSAHFPSPLFLFIIFIQHRFKYSLITFSETFIQISEARYIIIA